MNRTSRQRRLLYNGICSEGAALNFTRLANGAGVPLLAENMRPPLMTERSAGLALADAQAGSALPPLCCEGPVTHR